VGSRPREGGEGRDLSLRSRRRGRQGCLRRWEGGERNAHYIAEGSGDGCGTRKSRDRLREEELESVSEDQKGMGHGRRRRLLGRNTVGDVAEM
jgi:hypothetical protein